jgi:hypothetical protein
MQILALIRYGGSREAAASILGTKTPDMVNEFYTKYEQVLNEVRYNKYRLKFILGNENQIRHYGKASSTSGSTVHQNAKRVGEKCRGCRHRVIYITTLIARSRNFSVLF